MQVFQNLLLNEVQCHVLLLGAEDVPLFCGCHLVDRLTAGSGQGFVLAQFCMVRYHFVATLHPRLWPFPSYHPDKELFTINLWGRERVGCSFFYLKNEQGYN